ncbi:MAG: hypothetical protein LBS97_03665 [Treponema sp.]|jgi:hypothetical protein|nr:hypothetical protein [Treponema sp.]
MDRESLQKQIDGFIGWMEKDGMIARWKERSKLSNAASSRKELNKKIRIEKAINETLVDLGR